MKQSNHENNMCVTIPGKIIKKQKDTAIVESKGRQIRIKLSAVSDVSVGDWILIYGDLAFQKISEKEAKEIERTLTH